MYKLLFAAVAAVGLTAATSAQTPVELKEGDAAPAFTLPGSDGKNHSLSDHKGKPSCSPGSRRRSPVVERLSASRSVRAARPSGSSTSPISW